jgi:hypothetical protein
LENQQPKPEVAMKEELLTKIRTVNKPIRKVKRLIPDLSLTNFCNVGFELITEVEKIF